MIVSVIIFTIGVLIIVASVTKISLQKITNQPQKKNFIQRLLSRKNDENIAIEHADIEKPTQEDIAIGVVSDTAVDEKNSNRDLTPGGSVDTFYRTAGELSPTNSPAINSIPLIDNVNGHTKNKIINIDSGDNKEPTKHNVFSSPILNRVPLLQDEQPSNENDSNSSNATANSRIVVNDGHVQESGKTTSPKGSDIFIDADESQKTNQSLNAIHDIPAVIPLTIDIDIDADPGSLQSNRDTIIHPEPNRESPIDSTTDSIDESPKPDIEHIMNNMHDAQRSINTDPATSAASAAPIAFSVSPVASIQLDVEPSLISEPTSTPPLTSPAPEPVIQDVSIDNLLIMPDRTAAVGWLKNGSHWVDFLLPQLKKANKVDGPFVSSKLFILMAQIYPFLSQSEATSLAQVLGNVKSKTFRILAAIIMAALDPTVIYPIPTDEDSIYRYLRGMELIAGAETMHSHIQYIFPNMGYNDLLDSYEQMKNARESILDEPSDISGNSQSDIASNTESEK